MGRNYKDGDGFLRGVLNVTEFYIHLFLQEHPR